MVIEVGWYQTKFMVNINGYVLDKGVHVFIRGVYVDAEVENSYVIIRINRDNEYRRSIGGFINAFMKVPDEVKKPYKRGSQSKKKKGIIHETKTIRNN